MKKLKGSAMVELVNGGKLKRADIMLSRTKGSLLGSLIRFGTGSYWNHAFMVYVIKDSSQGYDTTFIIESGGGGIDIHNIAHYLNSPNKYDVAVKRFEADWFEDDIKTDGLRYRRKIRGFALEEIDDKYDHKLILGITRRVIRQFILALLFPWQRRKPAEKRRIYVPRFLKALNVNAYICSGFVQWSYYQGVSRILKEDRLDESKLSDVIFNLRLSRGVTEDELLSTTPADLANSNKLSWKYIIKDGVVLEVEDKDTEDNITSVLKLKKK